MLSRNTDVQSIVVTDDLEVMKSVTAAGGTIVLWPESGEPASLENALAGTVTRPRGSPQGRSTRMSTRTGATTSRRASTSSPRMRSGTIRWVSRRTSATRASGRSGIRPERSPKSIELVPSDVIVSANQAAMVFEIQVTLDTPEGEPPATMIMDAVEVFVLDDDGKISELRAYWDMSPHAFARFSAI